VGFGFKSIEHAFAWTARDIVKGARVAAEIADRAQALAPEIETITGLIDPPAVLIERAAFSLLGSAAKSASDMKDAAQAKGLNISLDQESIQDLQQIAKYLRGHLSALGANASRGPGQKSASVTESASVVTAEAG
jgi:hypothetical protein